MLIGFSLRPCLKLRPRFFSNIIKTLGLLVFLSMNLSASELFAQVTCGTQSCAEGNYCKEEKNRLTGAVSYRCAPQGNQSVSPCASCVDGTSCRPDSTGSMACLPDQPNCAGACPNGYSQVYRNGQCQCPSSNNANNQETQNFNGPSCMDRLMSLREKCLQEIQSTSETCDDKRDSGLNSISNQASQIALAMGQQTSSSVHAACSKMAQFSQAANAAVAAYRLNCSSSISSCVSACDQAVRYAEQNGSCLSAPQVSIDLPGISEATRSIRESLRASAYNEMKEHRRTCDNFTAKINEANQAIANYATTSANSSQCANLTDGTGAPPDDFCKANPNNASCLKADCSNPQVAASNVICICTNTPNDPRCNERSQHHASTGGEVFQADYGSTDRSISANDYDYSGDVPGVPDIAMGEASSSAGTSLDGSQGSSPVSPMGGAGGGSAARGGGDGGSDSSGLSKDINGGFYGGGSAGGMAMGGSASGGGSSGNGTPRSASAGTPGKPDLRQFLPGGMNDPRGRKLAGDSSPHGISGPHSNIWKNIQNRYRIVSPTLMP